MTNRSRDNECYDYVVVGAGPSAMGLLYGLLEQFHDHPPPFSIGIVDQGEDLHDTTTRDPKDWYAASHSRSSKSVYHIASTITNRVMDLPIGKGVGGTSNINATLCTPPLAGDLASWPSPWRENLLVHVQEIQAALKKNEALQGVHASRNNQSSFPFKEKSSLDMATGVPTLAAKSDNGTSTFEYVRRNYFNGLVESLLENTPHLKDSVIFRLGSQVQKIIIDESSAAAKGLVCTARNGELYTVHATREVILCAGAIESPTLLQLSGVTVGGQVGLHLKDQVLIPRVFFARNRDTQKQTTVNGIHALGHWREGRDLFQVAILDSSAIQSIIPSTVAKAVRLHCNDTPLFSQVCRRMFQLIYLVVKGLVSLTLWCMPVRRLLESYTVTTLLFLMHPVSQGSVRIRPKDNRNSRDELMRRDVDIIVNTNYLQDQNDIETLRRCWSSIPRECSAIEIFPRCIFQPIARVFFGWDWFQGFCRLFSQPYYHFCSSCRMKTKEGDEWVVDSSLSVCNHSRLRVCDASVFPDTVSSPPALTCAALGYGLGKILVAVAAKGR